MAEDRVEGREAGWRQLLPWAELFRGFQVALDLNKLLLAAAGILLMWLGWLLLAWIFGAGYESKPPQWPGDYQRRAEFADKPELAWRAFKTDRERWNLMHEAAGLAKTDDVPKYEVEDLADTLNEYDLVKKKLEASKGDVASLRELLRSAADTKGDPGHPLDVAKLRLYERYLGQPKPEGRLARSPWTEERGPNPYLLVTGQAGGAPWEAGHFLGWLTGEQLPVLLEPLYKLVRPVVYFFHPRPVGGLTRFYFLLVFVWAVVVWAVFGGAITRIAAVQVARGEKVGLTEAVRFTLKRLLSYVAAPLFPLAFVFVLLVFGFLFGLFHLIPVFGDVVVDGLLWPVMLVIGLVMAVALLGLAVGWPLMSPTVSAEGTDSWEAVSRSFSYVFQKPWQYLWYAAVALTYGAAVVFFVGFISSLAVYLSKWAMAQNPLVSNYREPSFLFAYAPPSFGWRPLLLEGTTNSAGQALVENGRVVEPALDNYSRDDLRWWNKAGAGLVAFWLGLVFLLVVGFGYSYFWSAATIIYLLMRRNVDAAELDEVYLEEDDQDAYAGPPAAGAAAEPAKPGASLTMVEPPALRTPPVAEPPAPAAPPVPPSAAPAAPSATPGPAESKPEAGPEVTVYTPAPAPPPSPPSNGPAGGEERNPPPVP
jgi:hypothetical protein